MKKIVLILILLSVGVFGMTKQERYAKLVKDAQDKNFDMERVELDKLFKESGVMFKHHTRNEIINFAVDYRKRFPKPNYGNGLDSEIRRIGLLKENYWTGFVPVRKTKGFWEFLNDLPSWLKVGAGILLVMAFGGVVFKFTRQKE